MEIQFIIEGFAFDHPKTVLQMIDPPLMHVARGSRSNAPCQNEFVGLLGPNLRVIQHQPQHEHESSSTQ